MSKLHYIINISFGRCKILNSYPTKLVENLMGVIIDILLNVVYNK